MKTTEFPLSWPAGFKRRERREGGQFRTTLPAAIEKVEDSLRRFGKDSGKAVSRLVISTNYSLTSRSPADPGVAVYFMWDGIEVCIPVDRYDSIAANLTAIHHIIEARRTEIRHGTLELVRASFRGFAALPPPPAGSRWWEVLGVAENASAADIDAAHRKLLKLHHENGAKPDEAKLVEANVARDVGKREARP